MTTEDKVKNIIAFLCIMFGENSNCLQEIMNIPPDYVIEKFERYVLSTRDESDWGLHPTLRRDAFNRYCEKWKLTINEDI